MNPTIFLNFKIKFKIIFFLVNIYKLPHIVVKNIKQVFIQALFLTFTFHLGKQALVFIETFMTQSLTSTIQRNASKHLRTVLGVKAYQVLLM